MIADILSYVSAFDYLSFSWISREKNVIVDRLAKDALVVSGILVVGDAFIASN